MVFKLKESAEKAVKAGTVQFNNTSVKILPYSKRENHASQNLRPENQVEKKKGFPNHSSPR